MKHTNPMIGADGSTYDIPDDEMEQFKADMPDAKPAHNYRAGGQNYTIADDEAEDFAKDMPDAEPVRGLTMKDGKTRFFTAKELRAFLSPNGGYRTSDEFKADRDETDAIARERTKNAKPEDMAADDEGFVADAASNGGGYAAAKFSQGVASPVSGGLKMLGSWMNLVAREGGLQVAPGIATEPHPELANGTKSGNALVNAGKFVSDVLFAPTKEQESAANESAVAGAAGHVAGTAGSLLSFGGVLKTLGPLAGNAFMSGGMGSEAYISLYDTGIKNGLDPENANKYALAGGAIATAATAAMGAQPIARFLKLSAPEIDIAGGSALRTFADLQRHVVSGQLKNYLVQTGVASGEAALIMGAQTYGETLAAQKEQGAEKLDHNAALWEATKSAAEGAGIGLFMGGMGYRDFQRNVRDGVSAQALNAADSEIGRKVWAQMFPEGTRELVRKRRAGKDISRTDIAKCGYPEMNQAMRDELADRILGDFASAGKKKPNASPKPQLPVPGETATKEGKVEIVPLDEEALNRGELSEAKPDTVDEKPTTAPVQAQQKTETQNTPPKELESNGSANKPAKTESADPSDAPDKSKPKVELTGDLDRDISALADNPAAFNDIFNSIIAEREAGAEEKQTESKPVRNKGKKPKSNFSKSIVDRANALPDCDAKHELLGVLYDPGLTPNDVSNSQLGAYFDEARRQTAGRAGMNKGKKAPDKAERERRAIVDSFGGAMSDEDAGVFYELFGASESVMKSASVQEMAISADAEFDENVYNRVLPVFQRTYENMKASRKGVVDFMRLATQSGGPAVQKYLWRFVQDIAKKQRGEVDERKGSEGNTDGVSGGGNGNDGLGAAEDRGAVQDDASGRPVEGAGGARAEHPVPAGVQNAEGGGGRDGLRSDGQMAGHGSADGAMRPPPGAVGERLAAADDGSGAHADKPSVVRAANGNIDTRSSAQVQLTRGQRAKINAEAEELAKREIGTLTDAEIEVLRKFTGAGGLGYKGKDLAHQIAALNQHFTSYEVADGIWGALERAKVPLNDVCDPSGGNGTFPGRRPEKNWTICELEPTTARILRHLFPGAKVMPGTFEDVKLPLQDGFITNVPFLEGRNHQNRPDIKALHDFFFVHALKQTKPNGVVAFITSDGTMNKRNDAVRRELMESGDIIGAYRLPEGTFGKTAHTDVITDVIFIQKRPDGVPARPENAERNSHFIETVEVEGRDGDRLVTSRWYQEHPECVLGDMIEDKDTLHGGRAKLVVRASDATDFSRMEADYRPYPVEGGANGGKSDESSSSGGAGKSGYPRTVEGLEASGARYELSDGNQSFGQNIRMYDGVPHVAVERFTLDGYEGGTHEAKVFEPVGGTLGRKIASLQHIVDDAAAFQRGETAAAKRGIDEIEGYKSQFGTPPHKDRALKKFFKDNGEQTYYQELTSAFDENFSPSDVFREQTRHEESGRKQADEDSSLVDQALASEDARGEIRLSDERCKVNESDIDDLLQSGYSISGAENGKPVLQNDVLFNSGNLYAKMDAMRDLRAELPDQAAAIDRQIARLEGLLPTPKVFDAITFKGNEGWHKDADGREHEGWIMPELRDAGIVVTRSKKDNGMYEYSVNSGGVLTNDEQQILARHLEGRKLLDKGQDEADSSYLARERKAESSLTDIYSKIRAKIAEDGERVKRIERAYNELYNGYVKPDYTKAEYLIRDTVEAFRKTGFPLRANQRRWVTQALIEGVGINAHDVGGGKTMAAIALAHALKARGVCKKPMFVVPSKTIMTSWLNSKNGMQILFPDAKIVNLGSLPAEKRTKALFDLSNTNADAVFISHEGFESIQLPGDVEAEYLENFARDLVDVFDRNDAKKMEGIMSYINQVKREERDTRLTLDKLGVDCLIVDEAHNYKNVGVSSQLNRAGLGINFQPKRDKKTGTVTINSHRAHDFRFKADFISSRNNGRNVFLLTATPTPNKPIELYTMLRHLGPRVLADYGIRTDRDFAAKFFQTGVRACISTSGGMKNKEILTQLTDVFALKDIMGRFIDRIPMEAFAGQGIKLPNEKVEQRFVDMSEDMERVQDDIMSRVSAAAARHEVHEGDDTIIGAFMNGRDAAVTPYVYGGRHANVSVSGRSHDPKTDKIEYAVQETVHEINLGKEEGVPRTVIIFTDVMGGGDRRSVPEDIKTSLIARGMKSSEIAIVTGSVITNPRTGNEVQASGEKAQTLKGEIQDLFAPKDSNGRGGRPSDPKIKVIIGSTASIGEGLNLNTWTTLGINLDVPLTPGAFAQRKGRYVRFGNQHENVRTINLMTRGTMDTLSYSHVANKRGWNRSIWDADVKDTISVEDEMSSGGIDPQEILIESLRDPVVKIQRRAEYDLDRMQTSIDQAKDQLNSIDSRIATQRRDAANDQLRKDEHLSSITKAKREAAQLEASIPSKEAEIAGVRSDMVDNIVGGQANEIIRLADELERMRVKREEAKSELERVNSQLSFARRTPEEANRINREIREAEERLDAAKKDYGDAQDALQEIIKSLPKDDQPFARVYRDKMKELGKLRQDIDDRKDVSYHESVVATAERDIRAAEARIAELSKERELAEANFRQTVDDRNRLGQEWFDDFGGKNQKFKLEKATLQADMDAENRHEDDEVEWMSERQTIQEMPAPASTGARGLNKGKLPGPRPFEATGTVPADRLTTKADIFRAARELFPELHFSNKGTRGRGPGVLGWFEVENRVIRTVDPRGVAEMCHELGHGIAAMAQKVKMPRSAQMDFVALGRDLYGSKVPAGGYTAEGFAEFTRGFLCDYDLAKDFPDAHKWFFERFGDKNPDFIDRLFRLKQKILGYVNMKPEQSIRSMWDHKLPVTASEIPWYVRAFRSDWRTNWVDSNWPIMRAVRASGVDMNFHNPKYTPAEKDDMILNHPYMLATLFKGKAMRFAEGDALDCTTDLYGERTGDSLAAVLAPIARQGKERMADFLTYAVAMRGADYLKKGMEFGRSRDEVAKTIRSLRSPEFKDALKEVTEWAHRELHLLVDGGVITDKEFADICDANPFYVPMYRVFEMGEVNRGLRRSGKKGIANRKGGTQEIENPVVALVEMAARVRAAAQHGKLVSSLVDMYDRAKAQKSGTVNQFMTELANPVRRTVVWADKVKDQIAEIARARFNADPATVDAALKDTFTEQLFAYSTGEYRGKDNIVTIHDRTGKMRSFEIRDPAILDILRDYTKQTDIGPFEKAYMMLANGIRMGATTLKASFSLVANPWRDAQTAFHMNEYGGWMIPVVSTIEGGVNVILNTDLKREYVRMGGDMGSFFNGGNHAAAKSIAAQAQETNAFLRQMKKGLFTLIGDVFSIPELAPRIISYRQAKNHWMSQGVSQKAAKMIGRLCGGDLTIDYGRSGILARKVNRIILFFNAAVRELDQLARASGLSEQLPWQNPGEIDWGKVDSMKHAGDREREFFKQARMNHASRFWRRAALMAAFSVFAHLLRKSNDEDYRRWKELKPEYKWNNVVFGNVRLPVPFLDGILCQSLPVAILESMETGDSSPIMEVAEQALKQMPFSAGSWHQIMRNFSALSPEIDLVANKGWNEQAIVPERMRKMDPRDWRTNSTTRFAAVLGNAIQDMLPKDWTGTREMFAPANLEYLYDQHTGGLLSGLVRDIESMTTNRRAIGVNGDYSKLPIVGRLFLAPFSTSRLPGDFYNGLDELSRKFESGRMSAAELGRYRAMDKVREDVLSEFSRACRTVRDSDDIPSDERKRMTDDYAKRTIDAIRWFNDYAKDHDFTDAGIEAAVSALSSSPSPTGKADAYRSALKDVDPRDAVNALRVYGARKRWGRETLNRRIRNLANNL